MIEKIVKHYIDKKDQSTKKDHDKPRKDSLSNLWELTKKIDEQEKKLELHYDIVNSENNILKMITHGLSIDNILNEIITIIENFLPNTYASILENKNEVLYDRYSPNLPIEYSKLLKKGISIGPNNMSCGSASYYKTKVTSENISEDPNWLRYSKILKTATKNNLKSCYSFPIIGYESNVLGIIDVYNTKDNEKLNICMLNTILEWAVQITAVTIERDKSYEKLTKTNNLLTSILESQNDLIIRINKDGKLIYVNSAFSEFVQTQSLNLSDFNFFDYVHPDDVSFVKSYVETVFKQKCRELFECRMINHNNKIKHFHWETNFVNNDLQAVGRDISDKINIKTELETKYNTYLKRAEVLRAVLYASYGYLWYKDKDHKYKFCDDRFKSEFYLEGTSFNISGWSDKKLIEKFKKDNDTIHQFDEIDTDEHLKQVNCQSRYIEGGIIGNDLFVMESLKTPLFNEHNEYVGNVGFAWNRTNEIETLVKDIENLKDQNRIEILSDKEYPETPFAYYIKLKLKSKKTYIRNKEKDSM